MAKRTRKPEPAMLSLAPGNLLTRPTLALVCALANHDETEPRAAGDGVVEFIYNGRTYRARLELVEGK